MTCSIRTSRSADPAAAASASSPVRRHLICIPHSASVISPAANLLTAATISSDASSPSCRDFQWALTGPATHLTAFWTSVSLATLSNSSATLTDVAMSCLAIFWSIPYSETILAAICWGLSLILIASAMALMWYIPRSGSSM